ncbi:MAG: methylmalonyl-CoA mutase [Chloroflexi bacterium]|nr:methylmalonyl-CoA mutase [Chloroflexota bacterium]
MAKSPDTMTQARGKEIKEEFLSGSDILIKRLYTPEDVADINYDKDIGLPGEPPYLRGIHPNMYRGRLWTIRRYSGTHTPEETNKLYKREYELGQTGFSIALSVTTGYGLDSDDPRAAADVGVAGVPVDSLQDMEIMFDGLPVENVSTAILTCPVTILPLTAMYCVMAEKRGVDLKQLNGTSLNDIMTQTSMANWNVVPPPHTMRLAVDLIEWCCENVPKWHPVLFDAYNYREQDINAFQELAILLATAIGYIEEGKGRGRVPLDKFFRRFSFDMGCHNDFFEEIAKFRAARRMWYRIVTERYGITDPECTKFRFHVQSSGCTHTTAEPLNNIIRIAYQTLAAALGGAQSVHANSYEEGLCLPTEQGMLLSIRTEQILQEETNIINTVDPLGGSYYVEWLTSELERKTWDYLKKIESAGGIVAAIQSGWIHREYKEAILERQRRVASGEAVVVGVNKYVLPTEPYQVPLHRANPNATELQTKKLQKLRMERDNVAVSQAIERLNEVASSDENVMPAVIEAVRTYATIGEMCDVFYKACGVWRPPMSA